MENSNRTAHTDFCHKKCAHLIFVTTITTAGCVRNLAKCKIFQLEREKTKFFTHSFSRIYLLSSVKFDGFKLRLCKKLQIRGMMITSYLIGLPVLILCVWVAVTEAQRIYVSLFVASSYGCRNIVSPALVLGNLTDQTKRENGLLRLLSISYTKYRPPSLN